jgi:signal peptidase II
MALESSRSRAGLLVTLVVLIIIADQLSKAWFVFHLGDPRTADFGEFLRSYFSVWAGWDAQAPGQVTAHYFPFKPPEPVWPGWVYWHLVTNTGAAWSMFAGNSLALSGVSAVMAVLLTWVWSRHFRTQTAMTWAMGGIIGGALGNFIDRFRLHEVVDFIDAKLPLIGRIFPQLGDPYDFPIFNIADSCAVCGTLALALYLILSDIRHLSAKRKSAAPAVAIPAGTFDPYALDPAEKAERIENLKRQADAIRAGETFTPRSETAAPLSWSEHDRVPQLRPSVGAELDEPNDQFTPPVDSRDTRADDDPMA